MLGSIEGIKLGLFDGKVLVTILVNVYGIKIGLDVGTDLGSLDGPFDGSNHGKVEGSLIGDSLWYTNGAVLGKIMVSQWDYLMVKLLSIYVEM